MKIKLKRYDLGTADSQVSPFSANNELLLLFWYVALL